MKPGVVIEPDHRTSITVHHNTSCCCQWANFSKDAHLTFMDFNIYFLLLCRKYNPQLKVLVVWLQPTTYPIELQYWLTSQENVDVHLPILPSKSRHCCWYTVARTEFNVQLFHLKTGESKSVNLKGEFYSDLDWGFLLHNKQEAIVESTVEVQIESR